MVRDAVLREVVSSDLFAAVSGSDLAFPFLSEFLGFPFLFRLDETGAQNLHSLVLVLVLGFLVLAGNDEAGRDMSDADG